MIIDRNVYSKLKYITLVSISLKVAKTFLYAGIVYFIRISSQTTYLQSTNPHPRLYQEPNPQDTNVYSLDELFSLVSEISPRLSLPKLPQQISVFT
jgi:hypothetical protein